MLFIDIWIYKSYYNYKSIWESKLRNKGDNDGREIFE